MRWKDGVRCKYAGGTVVEWRSELHPEPQEVRGWIRRLWMTRGKGPIAKVAEGGISRGRESRGGSGRIG